MNESANSCLYVSATGLFSDNSAAVAGISVNPAHFITIMERISISFVGLHFLQSQVFWRS